MNKKIPRVVAAAVAALAAAQAQAQSSVTLFGLMDLGVEWASAGQGSVKRLQSGQWFGSRLGFRGTEDLGGGTIVQFVLEHGITADNGGGTQFGTNLGSGGFWDRQIWLALQGSLGRISGGVHYSLTDQVKGTVEPFTNGTSADTSPIRALNPSRTGNSIIVSTPRFAGVQLQGLYSFGSEVAQTATTSEAQGRQAEASITYSQGPVYLGLAYDQTYARDSLTPLRLEVQKVKSWIVGATYDFKVLKLHGWVNGQEADAVGSGADLIAQRDTLAWAAGITVPIGPLFNVRFAYASRDDKTLADRDAKKWGVGAFYDLSKRTTLYTAYSKLTNADRFNTAGAPAGAGISLGSGAAAGIPLANANSDPSSFNLGIRHSF